MTVLAARETDTATGHIEVTANIVPAHDTTPPTAPPMTGAHIVGTTGRLNAARLTPDVTVRLPAHRKSIDDTLALAAPGRPCGRLNVPGAARDHTLLQFAHQAFLRALPAKNSEPPRSLHAAKTSTWATATATPTHNTNRTAKSSTTRERRLTMTNFNDSTF